MSKRVAGSGATSGTIIVVDDEPIALEFCRSTLVRAGYNVLTANGGEQALNHFKSYRSPIDLALIDIVMPGMNGVELVKRLEKLNLGTRIVLMSGYSPDEVKRIVADDASSYRSMWKPFQAATLVQTVKNVLDTPPAQIRAVKRA
jgi:DNA-binding NtrC family response regulator